MYFLLSLLKMEKFERLDLANLNACDANTCNAFGALSDKLVRRVACVSATFYGAVATPQA